MPKCGCKIPFKYKLKWIFEGVLFLPVNKKQLDKDCDAIIEWNRKRGNCQVLTELDFMQESFDMIHHHINWIKKDA